MKSISSPALGELLTACRDDLRIALREEADTIPEGWSERALDICRILTQVRHLRQRPGWKWIGFRYRSDNNGNGIIWAVPESYVSPPVAKLLKQNKQVVPGVWLDLPKPECSADSVMQAVQGDGSAESYLEASILQRELGEYGAMWHGGSWCYHSLATADPWSPREEVSRQDRISARHYWKNLKNLPVSWDPYVETEVDRENKSIRCGFYTFTGFEVESICKAVHTFEGESMHSKMDLERVATGRGGYIV